MSKFTRVAQLTAFLLGATPVLAFAGSVNTVDGVILHGFDPVAYQTENKAVKGDPSITVVDHGATYEFASAADRDLFVKNPAKYIPAYGGYCSFGVTEGLKIDADPHVFLVDNGQTRVYFSDAALDAWKKTNDPQAQAEKNWPAVQKLTKVIH